MGGEFGAISNAIDAISDDSKCTIVGVFSGHNHRESVFERLVKRRMDARVEFCVHKL